MRPRTAAVVAGLTAQVAVSAVQQGLPTIVLVLQSDLRISLSAVGALLGAVNAAGAATVWGWGVGADRVGDRRVLMLGLSTAAVALAGAAAAVAAGSVVAALLALTVAGAGVAAGTAALAKALTQRTPPQRWGLVVGARQAAVPAGALLAAALLTPIGATVGGAGAVLVLAVLVTVAAVTIARGLPTAATGTVRAPEPVSAPGRVRVPGWRPLLVGNGCYCVAQIGILAWAVTAWRTVTGLSTATAAGLFAVVQGVTIAVRLLLGRLNDARTGWQTHVLTAAGVCSTALLAALAVAHTVDAPAAVTAGLLTAAAVTASGWNGTAFTVSTRMAHAAGAHARLGRIHGQQNTVFFTAAGLTPPAVAVVVTHAGWAMAWTVLALTAAAGAIIHARLPGTGFTPGSPPSPAPRTAR